MKYPKSLSTRKLAPSALISLAAAASLFLSFSAAAKAQTFTVLDDSAHSSPLFKMVNGTLYFTSLTGSNVLYSFDPNTRLRNVVYNFNGTPTDANLPTSFIVSGNTLYGTSQSGGSTGGGTIFAFDLTARTNSVLYSFSPSPTQGYMPNSLIQSGNILYGTTTGGGTSDQGTLFAFDTSTNTLTTLKSFAAGSAPNAQPVVKSKSGNILYGTTLYGGSTSNGYTTLGAGTLYAFDTSTLTPTTLHMFTGGTNDGASPGGLNQSGRILYGVTQTGGIVGTDNFNLFGGGTLFSFDLNTNTETILHSFSLSDGLAPSGMVQSGNMLYGITRAGGSNGDGSVFAFDTSTDIFTVLHTFSGTDGGLPWGLVLSDNTLYGATGWGGAGYTGSSGSGSGVLFSINLDSAPEPASLAVLAMGSMTLLARRRRTTPKS